MTEKQQANLFKTGDDPRRNTTGANKGSRWRKTLLRDLMTIDLSEDELTAFEALKVRFPSIFNSTEEKNFQFFLELKQVSLAFSNNEMTSQIAINSIKDRIEGKPKQTIETEPPVDNIDYTLLSEATLEEIASQSPLNPDSHESESK